MRGVAFTFLTCYLLNMDIHPFHIDSKNSFLLAAKPDGSWTLKIYSDGHRALLVPLTDLQLKAIAESINLAFLRRPVDPQTTIPGT